MNKIITLLAIEILWWDRFHSKAKIDWDALSRFPTVKGRKNDVSRLFSEFIYFSCLTEEISYPNTPLKSTCAYIEFDKFKAKKDNEGLYSDGWKFVYTRRIDRSNNIRHQNFLALFIGLLRLYPVLAHAPLSGVLGQLYLMRVKPILESEV